MKRTFDAPLTDDELRYWLKARETIFFVGPRPEWQEIERQVERLGFGKAYIVSATQGRQTTTATIRVEPIAE
jgi:hypothetical protein